MMTITCRACDRPVLRRSSSPRTSTASRSGQRTASGPRSRCPTRSPNSTLQCPRNGGCGRSPPSPTGQCCAMMAPSPAKKATTFRPASTSTTFRKSRGPISRPARTRIAHWRRRGARSPPSLFPLVSRSTKYFQSAATNSSSRWSTSNNHQAGTRAHFLAALLTAVCRPSLPIAPAIAMRSATLSGSGVGKKLLLDAISHVAFGQGAPSVALGKGKEFEKGVVAAVIRPDPMLVIDNFNGRELQSETLCTVLTDRPAMVRVLGVSDLKEANPRMLISIAGNGYTFAEDLVRRNFVIELDAKLENRELRKFAGNFLAGIAQQRPQLLQAALTIWRYGRQQVKSNSRPLGGYEQWSAWVRDPLVALGCEDPVSVAKITKH